MFSTTRTTSDSRTDQLSDTILLCTERQRGKKANMTSRFTRLVNRFGTIFVSDDGLISHSAGYFLCYQDISFSLTMGYQVRTSRAVGCNVT